MRNNRHAMSASDQILDEIKERWGKDIEFLNKYKGVLTETNFGVIKSYTDPAKDIRYLLNRLEAAEKAARKTGALYRKLWKKFKE